MAETSASTLQDSPLTAAPAPPTTCARSVTLTTSPGREVRECVLRPGHGGDHRDGDGYPWNNARWID